MDGNDLLSPEDERDEYWVDKFGRLEDNQKFLVYESSGAAARRATAEAAIAAEIWIAEQPLEIRASWYLAGLALLAHRYGAGADGATLIAAPAPQTDPSAANPLFFRVAVDESQSTERYLESVVAEVEQALLHRSYSMPNVLARLHLQTRSDLLRCIGLGFSYTEMTRDFTDLSDFPLAFEVRPAGGSARLRVHYDAGAVAPELAHQAAAHYARTLTFLAERPPRRLADFDLLRDEETRQLLHQLNDNAVGRPADLLLHGLFERQAALRPDAVAVAHGSQRLTYGAVDRLADRLARELKDQFSVGLGETVALMLPRSAELVVGMLGVLKLGGAYVPIDPAYPPDLVSETLEDSGAKVLLLNSDHLQKAGRFPGDYFFMDLQLLDLGAAAGGRAAEIPGEIPGASAAYVIYTSGSTGKRKGVVIAHAAIVNTILWHNEHFRLDAGTVNLQVPSYTFDSSVEDFYCTLAAGGTLVLPTEAERGDTRVMQRLIREHGVTHLLMTPSFHRAFLLDLATGFASEQDLASLRAMTIAGEETTPDLVRKHYEHLPRVALINEYGPTENSVCSTVCALAPNGLRVPIGKPIANVAAFVLDPLLRLLPKGARGELYLGGPGLARGYLNRPELTAERFVPNLLVPARSSRLYRTGDLARWGVDGELDFLGRVDHQVKVRGFRVELGEIEVVLRRHPAVVDVAVICTENERKEKRLIAWLVGPEEPEVAEIRRFLSQTLPHFMVPDLFRLIEKLPVTVHGKVDRHQLAALDPREDDARAEPPPGASPVETALLGILAETLANREIGIDHDFFEHGGNSLAVLATIAKVRAELKTELAASDIYNYRTARKLAALIEEGLLQGSKTMRNEEPREFDVVIAGGGLAGLCLARQLRLNHPEWSVLLIDRLRRPLPEAEFKVGESTIEVGAYYFAQTLQLRSHMEGAQLEKFGLRYFFGGGRVPLAKRSEVGLASFLPAKSYQISRGKMENFLRELVVADGAELEEGFVVDEIDIASPGAKHGVTYRRSADGLVKKARCRWVIDAMGRRRYLQKRFDLCKPGRGTYNSAWFRVEGALEVDSLAAEGETLCRRVGGRRWYSTNHLMGPGYWVWLIPLADDKTSVGIVALEDLQPFAEYDTYEKALGWLEKNEPELARVLPNYEVLDFKKFHGYSYSSKQVFSADRWACIGEAGLFIDPYYSVGSNMIAFGNSFVQRMMELDEQGGGEDLRKYVAYANQYYLALAGTLAHSIQSAYPFMHNGRVMMLKTIWDYFIGWALSDPQFYHGVFLDSKLSGVIGGLVAPIVAAQEKVLQLFEDWARATASAGDYGFEFVDYFADVPTLRYLFLKNLPPVTNDPDVLAERFKESVDRIEELAQVLFLLAVEDVLPEQAHRFRHLPWLNAEGISLNSERWEEDGLFQPKTPPRSLASLHAEMRGLFRLAAAA